MGPHEVSFGYEQRVHVKQAWSYGGMTISGQKLKINPRLAIAL